MSSAVKAVILCAASSVLAACTAQNQTDKVVLNLGDVEDYADFLEDRGDVVVPVPFKPEPLFVSAVGKVQAQPDIAVITAVISAENKNESRAVNEMGEIINQVQNALTGLDIETGFTAVDSTREFDEACQNENRFAIRRHNQIRNDYNFNKRLDRQGDTKTKRRDLKPRVSQQTCNAQKIKTSTNMVIRIQPADVAGFVLQALSEAGAENSRLYGYDFTDYDALYQEAAQKAVKLAREKAQTVARVAGGTLGEIENFSVSAPERQGRFGPQPNVIRPANRYQGQTGSAIDRRISEDNRNRGFNNQNYAQPASVEYLSTPPTYDTVSETVVVQEASTELVNVPAIYETVYEDGIARRVIKTPASTQERAIPAVTKQQTRRVVRMPASTLERVTPTITNVAVRTDGNSGNTNALSISLLSGPQTISVRAQLGYTYETPLNGKIIVEPDVN